LNEENEKFCFLRGEIVFDIHEYIARCLDIKGSSESEIEIVQYEFDFVLELT